MFKNKWTHKFTGGHLFTSRKSSNDRQYQKPTSHVKATTKQDFLSNIVEEGSSEDIPKTLEQEEQYLNECLRSVGGSTEDVQCSEVEEYDFDDFNSIASTASILNLNSDLNDVDRLRIISPPPTSRSSKPIPNGIKSGPTWSVVEQPTNGLSALNSNDRLTNFQKSISRVQNWDRLGRSGEQEDWKQVLLRAAEAGDLNTVQDAVSHLGAQKDSLITARDTAGNTPLHKAAQNGRLQCLKWLVKRAPLDAVTIGNNDDMTSAAMATQHGQLECLEWLIEQTQASKELEIKNSFTLVHYAAKEGQEECLKYLLSYLSKTRDISDISDSNGITPAHLAAREGHVECLQTLVDYTNDVTLRDKEGLSSTDYAFKAGQTGCGRYLVLVKTCFDLSGRVKSLSESLANCRKENEELRSRLQVLESRSHMLDRPEAVGGDQSDSSSTVSMDNVVYLGTKTRPFIETRRSSSAPDGESPTGTKKESTVYEYQENGHLSPNPRHHRPSIYDIEPKSRLHLSEKVLRRRGSYPTTHAERSNSKDDTQRVIRNDDTSFQRHSWSSQRETNEDLPPTTPPNCATVTMTTSPVCHVIQRRNEAYPNKYQEYSTNSARSSRSQSPYRSNRSTASSTETVLVANSTEYNPRTSSKRNENGIIYSSRANSLVMMSYGRKNGLNKMDNRASCSSESPFSSDSDVEHTYERRNTHQSNNRIIPPREGLKEIRTERVIGPSELVLQTSNSTNHSGRLSYHGVDAHESIVSSCRTPERQAQVTWRDPRTHRRYTTGNSTLSGNNRYVAKVLPHQTENLYKITTRVHDEQGSFTFQPDNTEEKPWYETEEVEL